MNSVTMSLTNYFEGFRDIRRLGVFRFLIFPGFISSGLFLLIYYITSPFFDQIEDWMIGVYPFIWGKGIVDWLIHTFSVLIWIGSFLFFFKYILFVVMSPFMSVFSERIEAALSKDFQTPTFNIKRFVSDLARGIRIAARNFTREMIIVAVLLILSFVPGFQIITGPLIFVVQAYYAGVGNFDYVLERKYDVPESIVYNRRNRLLLISNGAIFLLLLTIPVIGWFLASPLATSSATRSFVQIQKANIS